MLYNGLEKDNYFAYGTDIGIIGRGVTIEDCFAEIARVMFSLMIDVTQIHLKQIITFEFEEEDLELALLTWLNLLLEKANAHHLACSDFRLKKVGKKWKATVSGEHWHQEIERGTEVKSATRTMLSVKKIEHSWEAQCVIEV